MRTTIVLPPELLRRAKSRSAARGESLKALITRAVSMELSHAPTDQAGSRVSLPLFGDSRGPKVRLSNEDLARHLSHADTAAAAKARSRSRRRRRP